MHVGLTPLFQTASNSARASNFFFDTRIVVACVQSFDDEANLFVINRFKRFLVRYRDISRSKNICGIIALAGKLYMIFDFDKQFRTNITSINSFYDYSCLSKKEN